MMLSSWTFRDSHSEFSECFPRNTGHWEFPEWLSGEFWCGERFQLKTLCHRFSMTMNSPNLKSCNFGQIGTKWSLNVVSRNAVWMKNNSTMIELWPIVAFWGEKKFQSSRSDHNLQDCTKNWLQFRHKPFNNVLKPPWNEHHWSESTQICCKISMIGVQFAW